MGKIIVIDYSISIGPLIEQARLKVNTDWSESWPRWLAKHPIRPMNLVRRLELEPHRPRHLVRDGEWSDELDLYHLQPEGVIELIHLAASDPAFAFGEGVLAVASGSYDHNRDFFNVPTIIEKNGERVLEIDGFDTGSTPAYRLLGSPIRGSEYKYLDGVLTAK